jgi:hypothetical protein
MESCPVYVPLPENAFYVSFNGRLTAFSYIYIYIYIYIGCVYSGDGI